MNTIPVLHSDEIEEDRPTRSLNRSMVCQNLGGELHRFRDRVSVHQQLALSLNGWQAIPDLCTYPREAIPRDWMMDQNEVTIPPTLVIEVLSPQQTLQPLIRREAEADGELVPSGTPEEMIKV